MSFSKTYGKDDYWPDLHQVRVLGKKGDANRHAVVTFTNLKDKEKIYMKILTYHLEVEDQCIIEAQMGIMVTCPLNFCVFQVK